MIGDRVDNDIIPAKKIGMKTVRVKQGMWKYWDALGEEEQADFEVDDLNAVIELFGFLASKVFTFLSEVPVPGVTASTMLVTIPAASFP